MRSWSHEIWSTMPLSDKRAKIKCVREKINVWLKLGSKEQKKNTWDSQIHSWQWKSIHFGLVDFDLNQVDKKFLGFSNPEYTVCAVIFGWGGGAVNLRKPSSDTSEETSSGLTPAGRAKRHTKEQVNELFSSVIRSRLPTTTTKFPSKSVVTSSGWYLERSIAHYEIHLIILKFI